MLSREERQILKQKVSDIQHEKEMRARRKRFKTTWGELIYMGGDSVEGWDNRNYPNNHQLQGY